MVISDVFFMSSIDLSSFFTSNLSANTSAKGFPSLFRSNRGTTDGTSSNQLSGSKLIKVPLSSAAVAADHMHTPSPPNLQSGLQLFATPTNVAATARKIDFATESQQPKEPSKAEPMSVGTPLAAAPVKQVDPAPPPSLAASSIMNVSRAQLIPRPSYSPATRDQELDRLLDDLAEATSQNSTSIVGALARTLTVQSLVSACVYRIPLSLTLFFSFQSPS